MICYEKFFLKISSVSDVIANSSTEVFMVKMDDKFEKLRKRIGGSKELTFFRTEEDVKAFVLESWKEVSMSELNFVLDCNPLEELPYCDKDIIGHTDDEWWEFFKKPYLKLIGYAFGCYDDDCGNDNSIMEKYLDISQFHDRI